MRKNLIRLAACFVLLVLLPTLALAADFAVVRGGRLNLRQRASSSSSSLGKYNTGSWVRIEGTETNGWWPVHTMDGKNGYMAGNYLAFGASGSTGTVRYANGGYVNLRQGPSLDYAVVTRVTSGTTITILNDSYEWNSVSVRIGGYTYTGYMHDSLIDKGTTSARVSTRNGGKVNVRSGPSSAYKSVGSLASGTIVSVLLKGNDWWQIYANGMMGFMSTSYLTAVSGSSSGASAPSSGSSSSTSYQSAYVNNPLSTQVLNLRETASQNARSVGQYRNGTQVRVVSYGAAWCEVYVGTRHGYMMTRYLSFDSVGVPTYTQTPVYVYVTPTPTPIVQYITPTPTPIVQYITPTPTPLIQYITPDANTPTAGTAITLVVASGSSGSMVNVYNDSSLSALKASYASGKQATMLQYGSNVCMVLVDSGVAYVSTWNVNY